jgi:DNA repair ATPase RecN
MLHKYKSALESLKQEYQELNGQKKIIQNKIKSTNTEINKLMKEQEKNSNISSVLQKAAELSRTNTKDHLKKVVSSALKYVFGKDYEFVIDLTTSRGVASAEFYIKYTEGKSEIKVKPQDSSGGGVIDVISTALRFAFLELLGDPNIQGTIVLDEPGKMVSEGAALKMASLIEELKRTFGRQVIMSTHNDVYGTSADREILVSQSGAYSYVKINNTNPINVIEEDIEIEEDID